jgi:hypothetical protein
MRRLSLFSVLLVCLIGCASREVSPGFSLQAFGNQGYGVLVAWVSTDPALPGHTQFIFTRQHSTDHGGGEFDTSSDCDPALRYESGPASACGHLVVLKVPAGDYRVSDWFFTPRTAKPSAGDPGYVPVDWMPTDFSIMPGKVTYIGSISMRALPAGYETLGGGWAFVLDQRGHDFPALMRRYPQLRPEDIFVQLEDFSPPGITKEATNIPIF